MIEFSVSRFLGGLLAALLIGVVTWFLEEELGIKHFFRKLYARIKNASAEMKVNYNIETNMPFSELKEKAKSDFSQEFDDVKVESSTDRKLKLGVNQRFEIQIRRERANMISVGTNKMVTTARSLKSDFVGLDSTMNSFCNLGKEKSKESSYFMELDDITAYIYITTASSVFNIYKSRSIELETYKFSLAHKEDNFKILATNGRYEIIADNSEGLGMGISEIV